MPILNEIAYDFEQLSKIKFYLVDAKQSDTYTLHHGHA